MSRVLGRLSAVMALLMLVTALAACGGGGDDDDTDATSTTGSDSSTPTQASAASPTADEPAATATTASEPTPTVEPTKAAGGSVSVDALWYYNDGQVVQGGTSQVNVEVTPKDDPSLRVGFFESEVAGTGAQWRSSGWMAVITSSLLLGQDPSSFEFSFDVAGRIDGPSAGALMTVAVLAGYLGDEVNPDVTMTGTINPDGTIGPVGGISHKLDGAQAAGKTVVLVPSGQRYDYDDSLGQQVDLVQKGQQIGVEVKLVADIYAAYRELTGSDLPQLPNNGNPQMPGSAFDKYRAGARDWYATYQAEVSDFYAMPADIQAYEQSYIDAADYYAGKADQYLTEGQIASAYQNAFNAAALARIGREFAELDNLYLSTFSADPLIERLSSSQAAETRLTAVKERLEAENPRTASDAIALMDAFANLSIGQGLIFEAQSAIDAYLNLAEPTEDDLFGTIYTASYNYVYADLYLDLAEDSLSIGTGFGDSPAPSLEVLQAISETLRRGAEANIVYFESIIIDPWAADYGIHPDVAKFYFQQAEPDYLTAVAAVGGAESLRASMLKPEAQASVSLGSSLSAYAKSASLIAKYYSLGAQLDESGYIVGYGRETALVNMLDLADQRARQWLSVVANEEPVLPLYYYDSARLLRAGDATDQLQALNNFWQSAILSEALAGFTSALEE